MNGLTSSPHDDVEVQEAPIETIAELARIPIAFLVERIYDVRAVGGPNRFTLSERVVRPPYVKDYDQINGAGPSYWASCYDVRRWGFLQLRSAGQLVGGGLIAFDTPGVELLEGRRDAAAVWDIRIAPAMRRQGLGAMLFQAAEQWARRHNCVVLKVETQNNNVPACRFYQRQGCNLTGVNFNAYPPLPDEVQLIWSKALKPQV